jgi:hypothetical protein
MQQPDNQEPRAPVPLTRQQEFNLQLVKMAVLACCAVVFQPTSLLFIALAYAGAELAVAIRIHAFRSRRQR